MMSENIESAPVKHSHVTRRFITYTAVMLTIFLVGFMPMWFKARASSKSLRDAERQITLVSIQSNLASAVIDTRRGDYEPARQAISQFFNSLSTQTNKADASSFTQTQRAELQPLLNKRDDIITLLARSDPASADRLSDLFVSYRKIMNG
jgi:hypothetical protein